MINEQVSLDRAIEFLNSLLKVDADALQRLIAARVSCNRDLSMHPTVQCGEDEVGMLGILNGLFGTYDDGPKSLYGPITAVFHDDKLDGFIRTVPVTPTRKATTKTEKIA